MRGNRPSFMSDRLFLALRTSFLRAYVQNN